MKTFELTGKAKTDLRAIAIFTDERWGRDQRNLYIKQFDEAFKLLANTPQAGRACNDIKPGYRKFPQGSHIIFYMEVDDTTIRIVRILHKNMDVESTRFKPGNP